MREKQIP